MKKIVLAAGVAMAGAGAAMAGDLVKVETAKSVSDAADALEAAVGKAGATVFARVDHAGGAAKVGMEIPASQLLIFGNPKLGTPAMQADPLAGLFLPLKVLVYQDADGQVWLTYQDPGKMLGALDITEDAEVIAKMRGALGKLKAAAAE